MNDLKIPITKVKIRDAADVFEIMRLILDGENKIKKNQEHFWVIALDNVGKIVNIELIGVGSVEAVIARPMEVLSIPLQKSAPNITVVHNHPAESLTLSKGDISVTQRLNIACGIMEIGLLDHIIITENSYHSFEESGIMLAIRQNCESSIEFIKGESDKKNKLEFRKKMKEVKSQHEVEVLEAVNKAVDKSAKKQKEEMAKKMLLKNKPLDEIAEFTGLSIEEINSLTKNFKK